MPKERRLRKAVGELTIVVLGVMIALAADSWRESAAAAGVEAEYILRLRGDLVDGLSKLRGLRVERSVLADAAQTLTSSLDEGAAPLSDEQLAANILEAAQVGFDPQQLGSDVTYREMVASGQLALLRSQTVRQGVVAYYRESERLSEGLQNVPQINETVGELTGYLPTEFVNQGIELTAADRRRLIETLWADPAFVRQLRRIHAEFVFYDRMFAQIIEQGEALLTSLE